MKKDSKTWVRLAAALTALLTVGCATAGEEKTAIASDTAMLMDKDATVAKHRLIRLQEQPTFPVDERRRSYAMIQDRDDRRLSSEKPMALRESKP